MSLTVPLTGVRLRISFWFFAAIALFLMLERQIFLWYIALPVLIHELGHLAAIILCRAKVAEIHLTLASARIVTRSVTLPYHSELAIAMGGIAANLLLALYLRFFEFQSLRTMLMIASNLAVAAFNMLPIGNLDGGRIVYLLCARYLHPRTAHTISTLVSAIVLVPLTALAALLLLRGGNFTLVLLCAYLVIIVARK